MAKSVLIAGAGNILASDDGVGVHAIRRWVVRSDQPPGIRLLEIGTLGPGALIHFEPGEPAVLLDAVRGGSPPGTVHRIPLEDLDETGPVPLSVHDFGIGQLILEARLLGRPIHGVLLGVEPARLDPMCQGLSPPVEAAIPILQEAALREACRLLHEK